MQPTDSENVDHCLTKNKTKQKHKISVLCRTSVGLILYHPGIKEREKQWVTSYQVYQILAAGRVRCE